MKMVSLNDLREIEFDIDVVIHITFLVAWHAVSQVPLFFP